MKNYQKQSKFNYKENKFLAFIVVLNATFLYLF